MCRAKVANLPVFLGLLSTTGVIGGCSGNSAPTAPAPRVLKVSPSDLFVGSLKRLEPHLGMSSGAVRLDFTGPPIWLKDNLEFWQGGGDRRSFGSGGRLQNERGEVTISLRNETNAQGKAISRVVLA